MDFSQYLQRGFLLELMKRGPAASVAFSLLAVWVVLDNFPKPGCISKYLPAALAVFICNAIRFWISIRTQRADGKISPTLRRIYSTVVILNGICFGLIFSWTLLDNPFPSRRVTIIACILCGVSAASGLTLGASQFLQRSYILTSVGMPIATMIYRMRYQPPEESMLGLIAALMILLLYSLLQGRHARQLLESTLRASFQVFKENERLQGIIDSVPGFVICLDPEGRFSAMTQDLTHRIGEAYQPGRPATEARDPLGQLINRFYDSGAPSLAQELQIPYQGSARWHLVSLTRLDGSVHRMIAIGISVDELVNVRKELTAQTAKAQYSAKLASLGEMAGGLAHEVNNPLMIVQGSLDELRALVSRPMPPSAETLSAPIQRGLKAVERVTKIMSSLLLFSRQVETDPFEVLPGKVVLEDTLELCRARFGSAHIELRVEMEGQFSLRCRRTQISQVIFNLLNNAYDAVIDAPTKVVSISMREADGMARIEVSDSGPGISPEIAARMFEPFFTTKPPGKGTGLGLSISQGIIARHGGKLQLGRSTGGATFIIELPIVS